MAQDLPGSAQHPVGDYHRLLEQRHFKRGGAGCNQDRIGCGQRKMGSLRRTRQRVFDQLQRHILQAGVDHQLPEVSRLGGARHRHHDSKRRLAPQQDARGFDERHGVVFQLRHPAAGQDRHHRRGLRQIQRPPRLRNVRRHRNDFGQRMTDVGDVDAGIAIDLRFEGKHHQHVRDGSRDFLDPPAAPGPDRRTDEMHGRNPGGFQAGLEREVEVGCIDTDENRRRFAQQLLFQRSLDRLDLAIMRQHLEQAAHCQFFHWPVAAKAGLLHARSANAMQVCIRQ